MQDKKDNEQDKNEEKPSMNLIFPFLNPAQATTEKDKLQEDIKSATDSMFMLFSALMESGFTRNEAFLMIMEMTKGQNQ